MKFTRRGFTIVELLIVIVVIGIIAAIVVVSYRGVSQRANETLIADTVGKAKTQLELDRISNGTYPATLDGLTTSDKVDYQYTVSPDGQSYCLTGMHKSVRDTAHFVDQSGKIQKGACSGHQANPAGGAGSEQQGEPSATIAQRAAQCCGTGQQTVTLSQTPTAGNLLVAAVGWRSPPTTTASLSGSGWQTAFSAFDSSYSSYGVTVFWKLAGNSEPTSITATTSGLSSSNNLLVQEFTLVNTSVGAPVSSHRSDFWSSYGETGNVVVATDKSLGIGFSTNYRGTFRFNMTGAKWSNGLQDDFYSDHESHISIATAWQQYDQSGTYNSTASWGDTSGGVTSDIATVGLVIFPFQ